MKRLCASLALVLLVLGVAVQAQDEEPPLTELNKERIEAALKLTREAAAKYEFQIGEAQDAPKLNSNPVLRWSNPAVGELHGNVFLWTIDSRPAIVASLHQWFTPHTHMSHEFHSLSDKPLRARYDGKEVWITRSGGLQFKPLPDAPPPADSASQRLLQMRKFARSLSATKKERDDAQSELRLLPQPVYRYASQEQDVIDGALFALVQGTDPEVFVLLEAQAIDDKPQWMFAATRMNSVGFNLQYDDRELWSVDILPWADISSHRETYTNFQFRDTLTR